MANSREGDLAELREVVSKLFRVERDVLFIAPTPETSMRVRVAGPWGSAEIRRVIQMLEMQADDFEAHEKKV